MLSLAHNWPLFVFVVGVIGAIALAMLSLRDGPPPYQRRGVLLAQGEIGFFRALHAAAGDDWLVFSRVRLSDVLAVRSRAQQSRLWHRRIAGQQLDYVLCDKNTLEVKLAIQFVRSPNLQSEFLALALAAAGLPLLQLEFEEKYEAPALRKEIEAALGIVRKRKRA
jgi:hypothetical protein